MAKKEPLVLGGTDPKNEWFFLCCCLYNETKSSRKEMSANSVRFKQ
ncbi:hypothetical protein AAAC51_41830 [Priestia megaterium]